MNVQKILVSLACLLLNLCFSAKAQNAEAPVYLFADIHITCDHSIKLDTLSVLSGRHVYGDVTEVEFCDDVKHGGTISNGRKWTEKFSRTIKKTQKNTCVNFEPAPSRPLIVKIDYEKLKQEIYSKVTLVFPLEDDQKLTYESKSDSLYLTIIADDPPYAAQEESQETNQCKENPVAQNRKDFAKELEELKDYINLTKISFLTSLAAILLAIVVLFVIMSKKGKRNKSEEDGADGQRRYAHLEDNIKVLKQRIEKCSGDLTSINKTIENLQQEISTLRQQGLNPYVAGPVQKMPPQKTPITPPITQPATGKAVVFGKANYVQGSNSFEEGDASSIFEVYEESGKYYYTLIDNPEMMRDMIAGGVFQSYSQVLSVDTRQNNPSRCLIKSPGGIIKVGNTYTVDTNAKLNLILE